MNISGLQACLASCVKYIQDHSQIIAPPYFDEIPENFYVPSIYFPVPITESRKATLSTWRTDIHMECWFAAPTDWEAFAYADAVRDCILSDGCAIDILNQDGTKSGSRVRITEPSIRKQEDRIVRMAFTIRDYFSIDEDDNIPATNIYVSWYEATAGQRE